MTGGLRAMLVALVALAAAGAATVPAAAQDLAAYAARYTERCAACHGAQGHSSMAAAPSLGGQPAFYAITQLFLFRDGRRDHAAMTAIARGMSDDDLRGYAALIATLPAPPARPAADAPKRDRGAALAQRLHCLACHGEQAEGAKQVPRLAGQREDYLQLALRGFRAGTRVGYTPAMSEALAGLGPGELDDLAHALAHWPAPRP